MYEFILDYGFVLSTCFNVDYLYSFYSLSNNNNRYKVIIIHQSCLTYIRILQEGSYLSGQPSSLLSGWTLLIH